MLTKGFDSVEDAHDQEFSLKNSTPLKCSLEFCELVLVLFDLAINIRGSILDDALPCRYSEGSSFDT